MPSKSKVCIGEKFGKLTILEEAPPKLIKYTRRLKTGEVKEYTERRTNCKCLCDCGTVTYVAFRDLKSGSIKSCGCSRNKSTRYEICGNITKIYSSNGYEAIIDTEDLDKVKNFRFYCNTQGYFRCIRKRKQYILHRIIMDCPDDMVVDHINHNVFDNRKCNLRICTLAQNAYNKRTAIGVNFRNGVWIAEIGYQGKSIYLGSFKTKDEAMKARLAAEEKYFGEFRYKGERSKCFSRYIRIPVKAV